MGQQKWSRGLWVFATTVLCLGLAFLLFTSSAYADDNSDRPELDIYVVETILAEDIAEDEVPLAAGAGRNSAIGFAQVGLMGVVLAGSVSYALYGRRCDERLFALRTEVVDAERALKGKGGGSWT